MNPDEKYALQLQKQFDNEAESSLENEKKSMKLAVKLAQEAHNISDSDDDSNESSSNRKPSLNTSTLLIRNNRSKNEDALSSANFSTISRNFSSNVLPEDENDEKDVKKKDQSLKRPVCKYGATCYRKNPEHVQNFYHPQGESSVENASKKIKSLPNPSKVKGKNNSSSTFSSKHSRSSPFHIFRNKLFNIPSTHTDKLSIVFPDLISKSCGTLIESVQLNFMVDLDFLMSFYRHDPSNETAVLVLYGELVSEKKWKGVTCVKVDMPFLFGVHHTKMMMLQYLEGIRIVIHTANLIDRDWNDKTQGFWVSPMFPTLPQNKSSLLDGESPTRFKRDIVDYLQSYKSPDLRRWVQIVATHDFSTCNVFFVGSVPGYHKGPDIDKHGHMKLRSLLRNHSNQAQSFNQIIAQCSSIGSLGKEANTWLTSEFATSLQGGKKIPSPKFHLIYPSEEDVRTSHEGYIGGSCLPYNSKTHAKQTWIQRHLHLWRSSTRTTSMPHVKTYARTDADMTKATFFVLTSANLSKAAWGQMQKGETQLFIRSYEAGVLLVPKFVTDSDTFELSKKSIDSSLLPYDVPIQPYRQSDVPWLMDTPKQKLDVLGNKYLTR